jgi:hypothetical protein
MLGHLLYVVNAFIKTKDRELSEVFSLFFSVEPGFSRQYYETPKAY